jgi:hypothetical protein
MGAWCVVIPSKKLLKDWVRCQKLADTVPGPCPSAIGTWRIPTCETMLHTLLSCQLYSNVTARGKMIRENRAITEDSIEALEVLARNSYKRAELNHIFVNVCQQMILDFGDHFGRVDSREYVENISDRNFEILLYGVSPIQHTKCEENLPDIP